MNHQQCVTPELEQWVEDQARAGHLRDVVFKAMTTKGWDERIASLALEHSFKPQPTPLMEPPTPPLALPEPALFGSPTELLALDRRVTVLASMRNPRVVVFGGMLDAAECDALIDLAQPRMQRSTTVDVANGGSEVNAARTSRGMFLSRGESPLVAGIEARLAALLRWPVENGEGLQVLHYTPGAEYKPHYDYFDPSQPASADILKRGGQRVGTVVMYLNTPKCGGGTTFPDVDLEVAAIKGNAVFFSYGSPHPSTRSLHGGAPVIEGEKWVATKWLRIGRFD